MKPDPAFRPLAGLAAVLIFACALFFVLFPLKIAPSFEQMFKDFGSAMLPLLTRLALRPVTSYAALLFLAGGTLGGFVRPRERVLIWSLTAGGGVALVVISMVALYLPLMLLAGQID